MMRGLGRWAVESRIGRLCSRAFVVVLILGGAYVVIREEVDRKTQEITERVEVIERVDPEDVIRQCLKTPSCRRPLRATESRRVPEGGGDATSTPNTGSSQPGPRGGGGEQDPGHGEGRQPKGGGEPQAPASNPAPVPVPAPAPTVTPAPAPSGPGNSDLAPKGPPPVIPPPASEANNAQAGVSVPGVDLPDLDLCLEVLLSVCVKTR